MDEERAEPESLADYGYTAFEKWDYEPFVYVQEENKPWVSFKESFYRASEVIIDNLAKGRGFPEIEGIAAVFMFRHYLELALKKIIVRAPPHPTRQEHRTERRERGGEDTRPR